MPGLLDGAIASAVYAGFKGRLLTGTLRQSSAATLDDLGDPATPTDTDYPVQGFVDGYSAVFRAQAGIPIEDVRVSIFGKSMPTGVRPGRDDRVRMRQAGVDTWYQLRTAEVDPAGALWECQAYAIPAPE